MNVMSEINEHEKQRAKECAREIWEVFKKHDMNYEQALCMFAALTHQIGRKNNNVPGVAWRLVQKLDKLGILPSGPEPKD